MKYVHTNISNLIVNGHLDGSFTIIVNIDRKKITVGYTGQLWKFEKLFIALPTLSGVWTLNTGQLVLNGNCSAVCGSLRIKVQCTVM